MSVADWYSGKTIFVTGATGFMGKILIEKLLRSCPDINKIYLLIRQKRGKTAKQRLDDLINTPIFDKIREERENAEKIFQKLEFISGDVSQPDLGLSESDFSRLKQNVDIVFHMAANVRFDQPLKEMVTFNVGGTLKVLEVAVKFEKLRAFVHVSTSYCHCDETVLEEEMYKAPHNPRKILDLISWMDEDLVKLLTPHLLKNSPNTYAYTKCLTEELVKEYSSRIPIAIARPSIVIAAYKEPIPGWVDNLNGPTGILVGAGKGVIRTMHCNANLDADIVPVDIAINRLIILARELGQREDLEEPLVFNITCDPKNPITWGEALEIGKKHIYNYPFSICLWYPGGSIKANYFVHMLAVFFFHLIPAYLIDGLFMLAGRKPFLINTQKRIQAGLEVLQYYTTKEWRFTCDNMEKLTSKLTESDKKTFYTDMTVIKWDDYILDYILGARKYCTKEDPSNLPRARKLLKKMYFLHIFTNVLLVVAAFWTFYQYYEKIMYSVGAVSSYAFETK